MNDVNYKRLEVGVFSLDEIKIHPEMAKRQPRQETLDAAEAYLRDNGRLKNLPTVDGAMNLLDGYANYLVAKSAGMTSIKCRIDPDGTSRVIKATVNGTDSYWSPGRDLDVESLAPGDAVAVILEGKLRRAEFVEIADLPRCEAIGLSRAIRRWRSDKK